jgi:alkylated DNA repair protein (DNA oxidative demethylase)
MTPSSYSLWPEDDTSPAATEQLREGAVLLRRFALQQAPDLFAAIEQIASVSELRNMVTPGGHTMSVAMTNCGAAGWVTDRSGYRYTATDPLTGNPWPPMPELFLVLAEGAAVQADFPDFQPDACLVNRYAVGARMTPHQDRNERDYDQPIVSVSLGLTATFLFGDVHQRSNFRRIAIAHGDVVVWGGPARLAYHGILPLKEGHHELTGSFRYNLTFRKAQ